MTMTTDFDLTKFRKDQGFLTLLNFEKSITPEKDNRTTRISNVWVYLTCKVKLERLLKSVFIYFSKKLTHRNEHLIEQYDASEIKEHLHHYTQRHFKCDTCLHHRCIKHRHCLTYTVWFVSLLIVFFLSPSNVSALHDRRVIVKAWSHIKTVSSTHSFISGLSSGNPIVTKDDFNQPLDDINRLVDRSEDIIRMQDEEESRKTQPNVKPSKDAKDVRCPPPSFLDHGFIEGKDSRVGDTLYFRCTPGYKLIGPSQIRCTAQTYLYRTVVKWDSTKKQFCKKIIGAKLFDQRRPYYYSRPQSMLIFRKKIIPWNLYSLQLKSMPNAMYKCRFPRQKNICQDLVVHYYFNIRRRKCELYHFGRCHDHVNQFKTFKECQRICSRLIYQQILQQNGN